MLKDKKRMANVNGPNVTNANTCAFGPLTKNPTKKKDETKKNAA